MAKVLKDFHRGDTRTVKLTFTQAAVPIDITGHDIWITLKAQPSDPDPGALQAKHTAPADANSQAGIAYVTLPSDQTVLVPEGTYYYDIQWVRPGTPPIVTTVASDRLRVLDNITVATA